MISARSIHTYHGLELNAMKPNLKNELDILRSRVQQLEAERAAQDVDRTPKRTSRRAALRLAGAAAVGGVATALSTALPAAAMDGDPILAGGPNSATAITTLTSGVSPATLSVVNTNGWLGVQASTVGYGYAVYGELKEPVASAGFGVVGRSMGTQGYGLGGFGGAAQLFLSPSINHSTLPTTGTHSAGEVVVGADKGMYFCVEGNGSGIGTWRVLTHKYAAGAFFAITPTRVYDSRKVAPAPGVLASGLSRTLSVADTRDLNDGHVTGANIVPSGASAVAFNLTVVATQGLGFLAMNQGGNTTVSASTVNWSSSGATISNASVVPLDQFRQVTVICGGSASAQTHFIIDVVGYYR